MALLSPQFVKPYRKGHQTDENDALAIVEAGLRPKMRFVPLKGLERLHLLCFESVRAN